MKAHRQAGKRTNTCGVWAGYRLVTAPLVFWLATLGMPLRVEAQQSKRVVPTLFVAGLNQSASGLHEWMAALSKHGFSPTGIDVPVDFQNAGLTGWRRRVGEGVKEARRRSDAVVLGGSSLGALLVLDWMISHPSQSVSGVILVNPPLFVSGYAAAVQALFPLWWTGLSLPSLTPLRYRLASMTSIRAYQALFGVKGEVRRSMVRSGVSGVVFISEEDEMVDGEATREWVRRVLPRVEIVSLPPEASHFRHLKASRAHFGELGWARAMEALGRLEDRVHR